jgi:hypothetical protein
MEKIIINKPENRAYYWESDRIRELFPEFSFESWNSGFNSTEKKNLKRVAQVLDYLNELNSYNLKSNGEHFFYNVKTAIIDLMKEQGFDLKIRESSQKYYFVKLDMSKWENLSFKQRQKVLIDEAKKESFDFNELIPFSKSKVKLALKKDIHLNNLSLIQWDNVASNMQLKRFIDKVKKKYKYSNGVSLSDGVCFLKEWARTEYIKGLVE